MSNTKMYGKPVEILSLYSDIIYYARFNNENTDEGLVFGATKLCEDGKAHLEGIIFGIAWRRPGAKRWKYVNKKVIEATLNNIEENRQRDSREVNEAMIDFKVPSWAKDLDNE